jgi:hypothetical protein
VRYQCRTIEEILRNMIELNLEGMHVYGQPIPEPSSSVE